MAKEQNLSLNPSKISGICGRLMCCLRYEADVYKTHKSLYGDGCPGCQTLALADEFFNEVEDEEEFYSDLLKEDTIQAVDYEIMREAAEVEERPLISRDPSDEAAAPEGEKADSETSHEQPKPARKGSSKRKKSAKRRKAPEGEKRSSREASAAEQEQEKPKPKPKLRPRRKRRKPSGERSEARKAEGIREFFTYALPPLET